jgi:hypothetical protein
MGKEVTENRPDIIIKNNKYKICILICCYSSVQKCHAKESRKVTKILEFMYSDTTYVEHEMYHHTSNDWSHWNSNKSFKKIWKPYYVNIR